MRGIAKPIGGTGKRGNQPATIKEFNKRLRAEILKKKGLSPDYVRGKDER